MSERSESNASNCSAWTAEAAARLKHLYLYGCDKGDMPLSLIAAELGRTESACRSKLTRMNKQNPTGQAPEG